MASKKINWRMANTIANSIADKAFEHLIDPKKAVLSAIADEALAKIYAEIYIDPLLRFNIIEEAPSMQISILTRSDGSKDSGILVTTTNGGFRSLQWEAVTVTDDALWARARDAAGELSVLSQQRNALYHELKLQLEGKTTTAAVKAWPEAEGIINEAAGITGNACFTVPLENMLEWWVAPLQHIEEFQDGIKEN